MNDLVGKSLAEIAFRVGVWLIERIASSSYIEDVVYGIMARFKRRGPKAAASSAWRALPNAIGSRLALGPQPALDAGLHLADDCTPVLGFAALFYAFFELAPRMYAGISSLAALRLSQPVLALLASVIVGFVALGWACCARRMCIALADTRSTAARRVWLCIAAGGFAIMLSHRPIAAFTPTQDLALNFILPALACVFAAMIGLRLDEALEARSRRMGSIERSLLVEWRKAAERENRAWQKRHALGKQQTAVSRNHSVPLSEMEAAILARISAEVRTGRLGRHAP